MTGRRAASLLAMTVAVVWHCEPLPYLSLRGRRPWQSRRAQPTAVRPGVGIAASLALLAMTVEWSSARDDGKACSIAPRNDSCGGLALRTPSLPVIARPKAVAISLNATSGCSAPTPYGRSPRRRDCRVGSAPRNDSRGRSSRAQRGNLVGHRQRPLCPGPDRRWHRRGITVAR